MASSTKLTCTADVSISEYYPDNAYNHSQRLAFGCTTGTTKNRYYVLLKFSSLDLDTGAYKIKSAKLTVTKIDSTEDVGYDITMNAVAQQITSSWSESTTWNTQPNVSTTTQSSTVAMGKGHSGTVTFDVTKIVQDWADGSSQYGILLKQDGTVAEAMKCIADRTSSNGAYITVTYEPKGVVYIDNGTKFEAYQIYIDNGSGWDLYTAHIDNGSGWDDCQ